MPWRPSARAVPSINSPSGLHWPPSRQHTDDTGAPTTYEVIPMDSQFDLLLRGGRVIDPASGRAGMIDTHAHVYQHVTGRFGLNADMVGIRSGVTTLVDQGGPSCMTIPGFRHFIVEPAGSRVLGFISLYLGGGMEGHLYPELYGPEQVDVKATIRAGRANSDIVKGVKAHAEIGGASRWGLEVVKLGKRIAGELGVPLYIHLGQLWPLKDGVTIDPDEVVRALMPLMEP